jgi:hypothetical protein
MKKLLLSMLCLLPIAAQAKSDPNECGKTLGCVVVNQWDPWHGYSQILMVPKDPADAPPNRPRPSSITRSPNDMRPERGTVKQTDFDSPLAQQLAGINRQQEEQRQVSVTTMWCQKRPDGSYITTQEAIPPGVQYWKVTNFAPNGKTNIDNWREGTCTIHPLSQPPH